MKSIKTSSEKNLFAHMFLAVKDWFYNLRVKIHRRFAKSNKKTNINTLRKRKLLFYIALSALPVIHFIIFYIMVNVNSILLSFKNFDYFTGEYYWVGFTNFKNVLNDFINLDYFRFAFKNSFILLGFSLVMGTTLCLMFSFYLYKKAALSGLFRVVIFLPVIISNVALVTVYKYFVELGIPEIINVVFGISIKGLVSDLDTMFPVLVFFNIWSNFGVQMLLYSGAMSAISDSVVESAKLDGANAVQEFVHITFPLIYSTFVTFIIVGIAGVFINQWSVFSFFELSADYSVYTVGYFIYRNTLTNIATLNDFPYIATVGVILTLFLAPVVICIKILLEKIGYSYD